MNHVQTTGCQCADATPRGGTVLFDAYADTYDQVLNAAIAVSGETKGYFARGRLRWLAKRLARRAHRVENVLDYGCGTGSSVPLFFELLGCCRVIGLDVSRRSLDVASRANTAVTGARFAIVDHYKPKCDIDLAYCNGVFHHIAPADRAHALRHVFQSLRPGGLFAFWENNPWNPGTRYAMRVNPFDRDAVAVPAREGRRLLLATGFQVIETTYAFYFPKVLRRLRWLEPRLSRLPFGAQYLVLAEKPIVYR